MLVSNLLGPRPTPTPTPAPATNSGSTGSGGTTSGSGTTSSGGTSQTATPAPTSTTPPSAPPQRSEPVQPTTAPPTAGTATSSTPPARAEATYVSRQAEAPQPRAGADALQLYTRQLSSGGFRPAPVVGTIAAEVRRIETVEVAQITKSELIKQASVAMLAQANLRQQDVLDILNV